LPLRTPRRCRIIPRGSVLGIRGSADVDELKAERASPETRAPFSITITIDDCD